MLLNHGHLNKKINEMKDFFFFKNDKSISLKKRQWTEN